jgi:hypothetical protein
MLSPGEQGVRCMLEALYGQLTLPDSIRRSIAPWQNASREGVCDRPA